MKKNSNKILLKMINTNTFFYKEVFFKKNYKEIQYYIEINNNNNTYIKLHNPDGPAIILWTNNKIKKVEFWINGKRHRKWGPAIAYFEVKLGKLETINEEWYYNNISLTDKEIENIKKKLNRINKLKNIL